MQWYSSNQRFSRADTRENDYDFEGRKKAINETVFECAKEPRETFELTCLRKDTVPKKKEETFNHCLNLSVH